jgi:hypothetical protein
MKNILPVLAFAALTGCASPYAPQEFDFSGLSGGTIESALDAPRDIHAFQEAVEHKINPEPSQRLLIRLDDGRALIVTQREGRFEPGQRVRVIAGRIEPE